MKRAFLALPCLVLAAASPSGAAAVRAAASAEARAPSYAAGSPVSPHAAATAIPAVPLLSPAAFGVSAPVLAPAAGALPEAAAAALAAPSPVAARSLAGEAPALAADVSDAAAPASARGLETAPARDPAPPAPGARASAEARSKAPLLDASALFDGAAARLALERAAAGDYTVTVLRKSGGGAPRLAVLLGESHLKSDQAAAAGHAVLDRFPDYALEHYDKTSTWGRRFNWWLTLRERVRLSKKYPARFGHGSTTYDARAITEAQRHLLLDFPPDGRASLLARARAAVAAGTPDTLQLWSHDTLLADASELVRILDEIGWNALPGPDSRKIFKFDLEVGHRPDLGEKIAVWKPTIDRAVPAGAFAAVLGIVAGDLGSCAVAMFACLGIALALYAVSIYMKIGALWMESWPDSRLGRLFPLQTGMLGARDATMADNLARGVDALPGGAPMLAILGKAHGPGVRKNMIERHGFEDVGLDALSPPGARR